MAIVRTDIFTFKYFDYGENFHGSYRGMRYLIGRDPLMNVVFASEEDKAGAKLKAVVWPEPFAYDKTPDEQKKSEEFEYSEEGVAAAIDWLNGVWESEYGR